MNEAWHAFVILAAVMGLIAMTSAAFLLALVGARAFCDRLRNRAPEKRRRKPHLPQSLSLALARSRRGCQKSCPCRSTPEAAGRAKAILARLEEMSK